MKTNHSHVEGHLIIFRHVYAKIRGATRGSTRNPNIIKIVREHVFLVQMHSKNHIVFIFSWENYDLFAHCSARGATWKPKHVNFILLGSVAGGKRHRINSARHPEIFTE